MDAMQRDRLGRAMRQVEVKACAFMEVAGFACGGDGQAEAVARVKARVGKALEKARASLLALVEEFVGAAKPAAKARKAK